MKGREEDSDKIGNFFWGVGEQSSVYVCRLMRTKKNILHEWTKVVLVERFALGVVDTDII